MNKNLILTGMMGVGKSTIGRLLAKRPKLDFMMLIKSSKKVRKNLSRRYLSIGVKNTLEK